MKIFSTTCTFNYPWENVSIANWHKYPNEVCTHVVAVDVLRREVDKNTGILRSERLITVRQNIPKWLVTFIGGDCVSYVREVSEVDHINKTLTMRSQNLSYSNLLSVFETVKYSPYPGNPKNITLFTQEAEITAHTTWNRVCNRIEDWCVERFNNNAALGRKGFESVLKTITDKVNEGVFGQDQKKHHV